MIVIHSDRGERKPYKSFYCVRKHVRVTLQLNYSLSFETGLDVAQAGLGLTDVAKANP